MAIDSLTAKLVVVESPLSGDFARNVLYAKFCMLDCFHRNEFPYASHLLYTQILNDQIPEHRAAGMQAGFRWAELAEMRVFYIDLGMSQGMIEGMLAAQQCGQVIRLRKLEKDLFEAFKRDSEIVATPGMEVLYNEK